MKICLLSSVITALGVSGVYSHGTEVRSCITTAGNLRFYVEHWHRDLSYPGRAGTMDIRENHRPGKPTVTMTPDGVLNNVKPENLPDCASGQAPTLVTTCNSVYNDWVYYDFPTSCNNPVDYTLLAGNTVYLTEACTKLYPARTADTFTDQSPPSITVNGSPCNGVTVTKTTSGCRPESVNFSIAATDDCDPNPSLSVSKASGSVFNLGTTQVTATSTDSSGKVSTCKFDVTLVSTGGAKCFGDPHFKTWAGELYDFHGVCDLVLMQNPEFQGGLGMDIHVRTKRTRQWSYVEAAALRIGADVVEIHGGKGEKSYWFNGVRRDQSQHNMKLQDSIAGFPIMFKKISEKSNEYTVDLGSTGLIVFSTWNGYVRVDVQVKESTNFMSSVGLMGSYATGARVGRDNTTVIENTDEFGQEWQVLPAEPKLFHEIDGPQAPVQCEIPSSSEMRRRLAQSSISFEDAQVACSRVNEEDFDVCVFDVMATNDRDLAGAY